MTPPRILLLDNYDSFTYNLYDYVRQTGAHCTAVRNDALLPEQFDCSDWDGLLLSPGPGRPAEAGIMMDLIAQAHTQLPILGICLGHQALGEFFGARLVRAQAPVHGKTSAITHNGHPLFGSLPRRFTVMRYHSLILDSLDDTPLEPLAWTDAGEIMALAHRALPLWGVQFHPESILTEYGLDLMKNWVAMLALRQNKAAVLG